MLKRLLAGTALSAAVVPGVALAQETVPSSATANAPSASAAGLGEIVVTAQRTKENLQRAGIAVDVVQGSKLITSGITNSTDLNKIVPSLNAQPGGGANTVFFMRGVGNFTVNGYSDPAIAFNYDGVYLGRPTSTSGMFYDLERLEVLKGPQGTLYGRNATGGAINVIPAKPKPGDFSGYLIGSYGNYNAYNIQGAVNVPMGTDGALRLSGNVVSHDAYLDDGTYDEKNQALRLQMLSHLTPNLTVRLSGDYSHTGGIGPGSTYAGYSTLNRATGQYTFIPSGLSANQGLLDPQSQAYRQTLFLGVSGRNAAPLSDDVFENNRYYGAHAEVTWNTGLGTLTILPAWRYSSLDNNFNVPSFVGSIREKDDQYSIETRFNAQRVSIFDTIFGFYYFNEKVKGHYVFAQQALNAYQDFRSDTQSYAAFARATAHLTDRLRLIGGARYTHDDKQFDGQADVFIVRCAVAVAGRPTCPTAPLLPVTQTYGQLPAPFIIPPPGGVTPIGATGALLIRATTPVDATLGKSKVTYRAAAEYDIGAHSLLYASYETGYRSGGFALAAGHDTFQPEYLDAYTIGLKNRFFNNKVQLNLEAFLWKYNNQQVNHTGVDANGNQGQFTDNVGKSTNKGVEADLQILATRNTVLGANVQYLDARYKSFVFTQPVSAGIPLTGCAYGISSSNPASYDINCSGKRAYQSPKWTLTLSAQQTIPVGDYKIVVGADTQYKSTRVVGFDYLPYEIVGPTWTTNAQVSFGDATDKWSIAGFVRNIENDRYAVGAQIYAAAASGTYVTNAPRTYGIRGSMKF